MKDWLPIKKFDIKKLKDKRKFILSIDTRDWCFVISEKSKGKWYETPKRIPIHRDINTEWLTLEECWKRVLDWHKRDFDWINFMVDGECQLNASTHLNISFKYIRIVWTNRAFLWCCDDHQLYSVPNEICEKYIQFGKYEDRRK